MVKPLSRVLREAAETLAAQIEEGVFAALSPDARGELRMLPLNLASWAERAAADEAGSPEASIEAAREHFKRRSDWMRWAGAAVADARRPTHCDNQP